MSQASSANTLPYIGSKISLISNAEIRYEGILYHINTSESTVALSNVRSFGTEGRKMPEIAPSMEIYDFIVFRGKDIKDLTVCEPAKPVLNDPAIITFDVPPTAQQAPSTQTGGGPDPSHIGGMQYADRSYGIPDRQHYERYGQNQQQHHQGGHVSSGLGRGSAMMGYNQGGREDLRGIQRGGYNGYPMYGAGTRRYGGGFSRGSRGGRHVVGELPAQPNQAVKSQVSGDFDFVEANQKFEKGQKADEVGKESGVPVQVGCYNNKSSFFDSISCETLDRQAGHETKIDRDKQRQMDTETFGASAVHRGPRYRRGYRRGGGYRRGMYGSYGGGGSYGGYNSRGPSYGRQGY